MCIIILDKDGKGVGDEILSKSAVINPHGLGGHYLDTFEAIEPRESDDWGIFSGCKRPKVIHFRYATKGSICLDNNHPFPIGESGSYLYQNGSVTNLGSDKQVDTGHFADILADTDKKWWKDLLEMGVSRYVIVDEEDKTYSIYNESSWVEQDGLLYSKSNVPDASLIAVYGTLKQGGGNNRLLQGCKLIGRGKTTNKYPMVASGVPFVFDRPGEGHNIHVEVFNVDKWALPPIDRLEGHPSWYERRITSITLDNGKVMSAWLYFCDGATDTKKYIENYPIMKKEWVRPSYQSDFQIDLGYYDAPPEGCDFDGTTCPECNGDETQYDEFYDSIYCINCDDFTLKGILGDTQTAQYTDYTTIKNDKNEK